MLRFPQWLLALVLALIPILFASAQTTEQPPALQFSVKSFRVSGDNPLSPEQTGKTLAPFLGEYSGIEGLLEAANTLEQVLQDSGYSFYRVILPPQTLQKGQIALEVVAFKIGKINIKGNKYFSDESVQRAMPALVSGARPNTKLLSQQRYVANQHPSRQIELRFKESESEQAIDAHLDVQDTQPNSFFLSITNTGNRDTGHDRVTAGYQNSNFFGFDDQITGSFTISPSRISQVEQLGANYVFPLYQLGGSLSAYATTSDVDSGTIANTFDVNGAGRFVGASYTQYLSRSGGYTHNLTFGMDDKRFINDVTFVGTPIGVNVRSRPMNLGYNGNYEYPEGAAGFYLTYSRNLPRGKRNNKLHYGGNAFQAGTRIGTDPVWDVFRFGAHADYQLGQGWLLRWRGDAQLTDEPLISGEQFGLGGAKSVRGYEERTVSGDVGVFTSIEAWTPPLAYNIRALGFFDGGHSRSKKVLPGEQKSEALSSIGLGLRWFYLSNVSAEMDVARVLSNAGLNQQGDYKVHFNLFLRY